MSNFWQVSPDQAFPPLYDRWTHDLLNALEALCQRYAAEIETWLKINARWTDRSGNLRQSMYAEVERFVDEVVLGFDYGLDYGQFLEFGLAGRFSIIADAFDFFLPRFFADIQALLS